MTSDTEAEYTLEFFAGGLAPKWSKIVRYTDDGSAIAEGRALLMACSAQPSFSGTASLLIGRGAERADICWLGAWHWDNGPHWMPAA